MVRNRNRDNHPGVGRLRAVGTDHPASYAWVALVRKSSLKPGTYLWESQEPGPVDARLARPSSEGKQKARHEIGAI